MRITTARKNAGSNLDALNKLYNLARTDQNLEVWAETDGTVKFRYFETVIVEIDPNGAVYVENGGYRTPSTKGHLNRAMQKLDLPVHIFQKRKVWYVSVGDLVMRWPHRDWLDLEKVEETLDNIDGQSFLTDSQDVKAVCESFAVMNLDEVTGAVVTVSEGDYDMVYLTISGSPHLGTATYWRIR